MTTESQTTAIEALVGEDKKFKTVEDLAKGKVEADAFIATLQNQIQQLAVELSQANVSADRKTHLENLMASLTNTTNTSVTKETQPPANGNQPAQGLSHEDVVKMLEAREQAATIQRNQSQAKTALSKIYGEKTDEFLSTKAKQLGMTVEELNVLAGRSPAAFLNVVGANARDNSTSPMASHSSTSSLGTPTGGDSEVHNKAYYDNLRKTMGAKQFAFDAKLQVQLHKDMVRLGDAWSD